MRACVCAVHVCVHIYMLCPGAQAGGGYEGDEVFVPEWVLEVEAFAPPGQAGASGGKGLRESQVRYNPLHARVAGAVHPTPCMHAEVTAHAMCAAGCI